MYYRFECCMSDFHGEIPERYWQGIFSCMYLNERRKWYCLSVPKWYKQNPDIRSEAWFTQHGYEKWGQKMQETYNLMKLNRPYLSFRLRTKESLEGIVFAGKTQVIIRV